MKTLKGVKQKNESEKFYKTNSKKWYKFNNISNNDNSYNKVVALLCSLVWYYQKLGILI